MQSLIENYINGNLTEAKRRARDVSHVSIRMAFQQYGYSLITATRITDYLKGLGSFQDACDAEYAERAAR